MILDGILISIIIPVYNEKRYLKDCIRSIVHQTWKNLEIIIVDDGSDDETAKNCDRLAKLDDRIRVVHKKNGGLSSARAAGIEYSSGSWIGFADDDDCMKESAVEELAKHIHYPSVDIVAGGRKDVYYISDSDLKNDHRFERTSDFLVEEGAKVCEKLYYEDSDLYITPMWGKLYRKDFLLKNGVGSYKEICPTIFFEDVLMTPILYCSARKVCIVKKQLYLHRIVATSISMNPQIITPFYIEQMDAGDILLAYYKEKKQAKTYAFEIKKHMWKCLRLWTVIDDSRKEMVFRKADYQIKKYKDDYLLLYGSKVNKILLFMYALSPDVWRCVSRFFYYHIRNRCKRVIMKK